MDPMLFIIELVRALSWPAAVVGVVYIAKLILDKTEVKDPDDKRADVNLPTPPIIPSVQVRPPRGPRSNEAPPDR